jgi:hypothetical protein
MKRMVLKGLSAVALLCMLGGCAAGQKNGPKDVRPENYSALTLDCIFVRTIDDWKYLDPYHVIIYAPSRSTAYLLELSNYCQPLQRAERIGISSHQSGRLCARDQDALLVGDQRCSITAILPYKTGEEPKAGQ